MALPPQTLVCKREFIPFDLANIVETDIDCKIHSWVNRGGRLESLGEGVCLHFSYLDTLDEDVRESLCERFKEAGWDDMEFHCQETYRAHARLTLVDLLKFGTQKECTHTVDFTHHPVHIFRKRVLEY